ncbi:MAG: Fe-S cluster assembly protein SufD [Beijerinckiaceae bacterium]|jgi:Fe-S cluster assembly protein SufD|nr:Fe-S cluster assembly protein SufD [Beijerinckiaceae bacterium]
MSSNITRISNEAETALSQLFISAADRLPGNSGAERLRTDAIERFASLGLPGRRVEAWHYTDLRAAVRSAYPLAPAPDAQALASAKAALADVPEAGNLLVLVDGVYAAALSVLAPGPEIALTSLEEALAGADADFVADITAGGCGGSDSAVALNAALMTDGVVITINANAHPGMPLNIVSITTQKSDAAIFTRCLVRAGEGSTASIVERHINLGDAGLQASSVLVINAGAKSNISHVFIGEGQGAGLLHVNTLLAGLGEGAQFSSFGLLDTGAFVRRQIFARFNGPDARLDLAGLSLIRNKDHMDTTLVVEHIYPDCNSAEYFKHIVDGSGTGVFQGKISVAPEAQKTDGAMKSQTIMLSDDAAMYNKPELEIFADDVACGHGATCGSLDKDQLFYAMARGLSRSDAQALLLEAFGADAIERVMSDAVKDELTERLRNWLTGRKR